MSAQRYKAMARKHWTEWLPEKVKDLKETDSLDSTLMVAGTNAQNRVLELMAQGHKAHEAEEVALQEYVLLRPEEAVADESQDE